MFVAKVLMLVRYWITGDIQMIYLQARLAFTVHIEDW